MPSKHLPISEIAQIQAKHELVMKKAGETTEMVAAPMTIDTNKMPQHVFRTLPGVMPLFNSLVDSIARDTDYLINKVGPTDPFSQKMAEIVKKVYVEGKSNGVPYQSLMLGLLRSDYLFDEKKDADDSTTQQHQSVSEETKKAFANAGVPLNFGWKQVEINTIASSFPALSTRTGLAYRDMMNQLHAQSPDTIPAPHVHVSTSERDVINALDRAHRFFLNKYPNEGHPTNEKLAPVVVFLVQEGERNVGDQGLLRRGLEQLGVHVVRKSIVDLNRDLRLEAGSHFSRLRIRSTDDGGDASYGAEGVEVPVSLFYFRSLYDYGEYEKYPEFAWDVRLKVEQTMSIKCPSAPYHLCTWKIIQKHLYADFDLLKRFMGKGKEQEATVLRNFMVPHYALADYEKDESIQNLIKQAIANPRSFIVKTLREGYGFVLDGQELVSNLTRLIATPAASSISDDEVEWKKTFSHTHLLVYRINSNFRPGAILRNNEIKEYEDLETEVGTYGAIFTDEGGKVHFNVEAGYLLRTKSKSMLGGGVMSGVSSLDSVEFI